MISVLKWEFGPVEAIFLTTFVGLSVDYIVHVAHACSQSFARTRRQKVEKALMNVGSAVLNGAMTTLAAHLVFSSYQFAMSSCCCFIDNVVHSSVQIVSGRVVVSRQLFSLE